MRIKIEILPAHVGRVVSGIMEKEHEDWKDYEVGMGFPPQIPMFSNKV